MCNGVVTSNATIAARFRCEHLKVLKVALSQIHSGDDVCQNRTEHKQLRDYLPPQSWQPIIRTHPLPNRHQHPNPSARDSGTSSVQQVATHRRYDIVGVHIFLSPTQLDMDTVNVYIIYAIRHIAAPVRVHFWSEGAHLVAPAPT